MEICVSVKTTLADFEKYLVIVKAVVIMKNTLTKMCFPLIWIDNVHQGKKKSNKICMTRDGAFLINRY